MNGYYKVYRGGFTHYFFEDLVECRAFAVITLELLGIDYTLCGFQVTIAGEVPWL